MIAGLLAVGTALGWLFLRGDADARAAAERHAPPAATVAQSTLPAADLPSSGELAKELERKPIAAGVPDEDPADPAEPHATIHVTVRLAQSNLPRAGCNVHVMVPQEIPGRWMSHGHESTDADGRCKLEVPANVEFALQAGSQFPGEESAFGGVREEMTPLMAGETREVVLVLPEGDDTEFYGRLVAEESGLPLAGGRILLPEDRAVDLASSGSSDAPALATSGVDGLFRLRYASWRGATTYLIELPGYGPALFRPTTGYSAAATPLELALRRAGTLSVRVLGADIGQATLRIETNAYELAVPGGAYLSGSDPYCRVELGDALRAELVLPARVPLTLTLKPAGKGSLRYREPITLVPGEQREIAWLIGGGARLTGRLLDQNDEPVPGADLWLSRRALAGDARAGTAFFYSGDRDLVQDEAETGADGSFVFEDVPVGFWWVGPRADRLPDEVGPRTYAPLATGVEIQPGDAQRDVLIRTWRGVVISGQVLDPWGKPAPEESLYASSETVGGSARGRSDADGAFRLGPLVPGEYLLHTGPFSKYASAEPVSAPAGATNVVLKLREAGGVAGIVVDGAGGGPVASSMWVSFRGVGKRSGARSEADGLFERTGLEPGVYDIAASAPDGLAGVLPGVEVRAGEQATDLRVELRPGARLTVLYTGPTTYANYTIFRGEVPTAFDGLHTGTSATKVVPAGALRVEMKTRDGLVETREITLEPGTEETLAFEFERESG